MRILLDQNMPLGLRRLLMEHQVVHTRELGWDTLLNGESIAAAEREAFDALVTADQNIRYQQNLSKRRIGIVVVSTSTWSVIREHLVAVSECIERAGSGECCEVDLPRPPLKRRPPPDAP